MIQSKIVSMNNYKHVKIDGETIRARVINFQQLLETTDFDLSIKAKSERKVRFVTAEEAGSTLITKQDGKEYVLEEGDIIIQNPGEDPYRFGNASDSVEQRRQAFFETHERVEGKDNTFRKSAIIKVKIHDGDPIYFENWGEGFTAIEGSWITEQGYTIAPSSQGNYIEVSD
jgi:hypothetical protein